MQFMHAEHFTRILPEQLPAIRHVTESGKNLQDSLGNEVSASNVVTLIFPCLFALVPISSFDLPF